MQPNVPDDRIKSATQLAQFASDLLDSETVQVVRIITSIQGRYATRANTPENLEALRDEVLTRLSEIGILATVDPAPCFYGEPPIVEIIGRVAGHATHAQGFDHEQKEYEVKKATARGEEFLGQKERVNARIPKENS